MKNITLFALALVVLTSCSTRLQSRLDSRLRQMEAGITTQNPAQIAAIYSDDSHVIAPHKIDAQGREAIDDYWQRLGDMASDWRLESFVVSRNLEDILESTTWQELERKPRLPEALDIPLPTGELIYQLGRSHLTFERNGQENTSVVTFLLIWKKVEGEYQIWMDTYG